MSAVRWLLGADNGWWPARLLYIVAISIIIACVLLALGEAGAVR